MLKFCYKFPNKILVFFAVFESFLFWFFFAAIAIQCGYAFYFFTRIYVLPSKRDYPQEHNIPVSIIICAKNEAHNLAENLPSILTQTYLHYEVIVVDDASTDNTPSVLATFKKNYNNLQVVTITTNEPRKFKGKKFALSKGVAVAQHEHLLLTDADCKPASENWIQKMAAPFHNNKEIACGYGGYYHHVGLLNAFIRWETMHTFLQYATYTLAGKPYMGVGRNMATTKTMFSKAQSSSAWNELASGDDDLLVQASDNPRKIAIVAHKDAFTMSEAKANWAEWLKQKQRHISTGKYYHSRTKLLLGVYAISHALCWVLFFALVSWSYFSMVFILFFLRCFLYWTIWQSTAAKLRDKKLWLWIPLCDFGWALYNIILSPFIFWKNKTQWK